MSVLINADTSDGLKFTSDASGEIKLQSNGTDIATVDSSGITMASGKTLPASALTGTLPALDASSLTGIPAPAALSTASGSAPSYSARAWVNFNGTGTVAIRASGNVSSITDNNSGDYTINFTTAMPDVNYAVSGCGSDLTAGSSSSIISVSTSTNVLTTSVRITNTNLSSNLDRAYISVAIHR